MEVSQNLLIIASITGVLFTAAMLSLFFISRRSQKVMDSLLLIMTRPERARIVDASRVLQNILSGEINKIESTFDSMQKTLGTQISAADALKLELSEKNKSLVELADNSVKKMSIMTQRMDNTLGGLNNIVSSNDWDNVQNVTEKFSSRVNVLCDKVDSTYQSTLDKVSKLQDNIDGWINSGSQLSKQLKQESENNVSQMSNIATEFENMQLKLESLSASVADGFEKVRTSATDYDGLMINSDKLLSEQLKKLDSFTKQSEKLLSTQMNSITNTANAVGGQVRLVESSIEKQVRKLTEAVELLMGSAVNTESSVRSVSNELSGLTNRFNSEVKEFTTSVVKELDNVSNVANGTLENTRSSANAFSESVRAMATGVRETLMEMNTAHTQLSGQSEGLIKISAETTAQLQPLSELIEKYYTALPGLSVGSRELAENLEKIVISLNEKINSMTHIVSDSVVSISDSSSKLENLSGQSRQQMIDLMSDYAKAVETMQTLNKQMMVARASAPMDAIKAPPAQSFGRISSSDFIKQSEGMIEKLHEQSVDLTRSVGAAIPDTVWKKYHSGDKTIFTKWFAKMLVAADKKQVRSLLKSDSVFESQAKQFIRSFSKILSVAQHTDNKDSLIESMIKTDLGKVYLTLKSYV